MASLRSVAAFAICVATLSALTNDDARAQDQKSAPSARIVVTGEGSVRAAPDYAVITGGVTVRAKTAQEAAAANAKLMVGVMTALRDAGIAQEDLQTSRYSIQPVYAPQQNAESKLTGFSASNQIRAKVREIAKVGDILDRFTAAGGTDIGGVQFLHSDISKVLDEARQAAVADARRKAQLYAEAAGIRLGSVIWITEEPGYTPPYPMAMARAAPAAPTPIAIGEDTLREQITVGFDIAP
jgi:uncharacterized protein